MNSHPQQRNKRLARRRRYGSKGNKSNKSSKNGGSKSSKSLSGVTYNNQYNYTKSGKGSTKASKSKSSKANIFIHDNVGGSKSSSKSAKAHTNSNLFSETNTFDVHIISPHIPPLIQTNSPTTKPIVYMHSCTGEPCPLDTQCRSPGGMCGTNCNALSIWNSSCPKITQEEKVLKTPTPTVQPTTPFFNELECTGLPCTGENREVSMAMAFLMKSSGIPLCRSVNGACGSGTLYCNQKSIWNEDCPSNSPTLKPTVETLAPVSEQPLSYSAPPTISQPTIMQSIGPTVTLIPTCLLVQTNMPDSGGYIDVYVNDGSGSGYFEATTPNIIYSESQTVLDECYNGLVGVQIRNPTPRPWTGGITTSINNKLDYFPMNCNDCTIGLNFTELLDYTPPASSGDNEMMITTEKIVVDGNDMNEQGGGVALCLNGLDENGGNSCTLRNMATFQPTSSPTDTVSPTPQVDSSAAEDASAVVEVEIAVPSSPDEVEQMSPDDFESNKEVVSPSSSGNTSDSSSGGFPIGGYIGIGVAVVALLAMLIVVKKMRNRRQKNSVEEVSQEEEESEDELIDQQNDESFESRPYSPSESEDSDSD